MNLESRLLDGKPAGYCSSSEGEDEDFKVVNDDDQHQANVMKRIGPSANTGAKGVLNDFKQFREQARIAIEQKNLYLIEQAKRGMMMGTKEEREKAQKGLEDEDEMMMLDEIRAKRLLEMKKVAANKMIEITSKDQYSDAVDGSSRYLLGVLIYEPNNEECSKVSYMCKILAADFPKVKFIRATSGLLGMTEAFKKSGIPTLQFYSNGNLVGNFVKVSSFLGQDFDIQKLRKFLRRQHIDLVSGKYATDSEDDDNIDDID